MFDKLLSKFRKPEASNITNMNVRNLAVGAIFEYDLRTFQVLEAYEYDWGGNSFSKEFKVSDGSETAFLAVEEDDHLEISYSKKLKIRLLQDNLPEYIHQHEKPPTVIDYDGSTYLYDGESPGFFRNMADNPKDDDNWSEFISWDFYAKNSNKVLSVEQWGEDAFEASVGKTVKEHEISNILPSPD